MELTINGQEYSFVFGWEFVLEANKKFTINNNGLELRGGIENTVANLVSGDVQTLVETLKAANNTENPKVSIKDLVGYIDENGTEELEEMTIQGLLDSGFTGKKTKTLMEQVEAAQNK